MMKLLGVRCSTQKIRYALIEWDSTESKLNFVNQQGENILTFPKGMNDPRERIQWAFDEFYRIIENNGPIDRACLKINEYGRSDSKASRATSYYDGAFMLACAQLHIPIETSLYAGIKVPSALVEARAEELVGKTPKHWDKQMADAVMAAISVRGAT